MKKVLSTKLEAVEIGQLAAMAEKQGESKAEFLRGLVLDRINSGDKVDRAESIGRPRPTVPARGDPQPDKTNQSTGISRCTNSLLCKSLSNEGLHSKNFISVHHQHPTVSVSTAPVTSNLPDTTKADHSLDLPRSSKESLPVYHGDSKGRPKGRPEASTKSTTGKAWLLLLALWILRQTLGPVITIDPKSGFTT